MCFENWVATLIKNHARKKEEKLRKKYAFLIDEISSGRNDIVANIADCGDSLKKEMVRYSLLNEMLHQEKDELLSRYISSIVEKIEKSNEKMTEAIKKDNSSIGKKIDNLHTEINDNRETLLVLVKKLASYRECLLEDIKKNNVSIDSKVEGISLSIDEIQELIKIIAVNNLLDQIQE